MTSTSDLINATRRHLMASEREAMNRLSGAITNTATTLTFEFADTAIRPGALLSVGLELMYVWSVTGQTATVQRGMHGSTAAAHSDDALIYVNPTVPDFAILTELNNELASMSSGNLLYQVRTKALSTTTDSSYNLEADVLRILSVQYEDTSGADWPLMHRWDLLPNQDTGVFPSGNALRFFELPAVGRTLRVTYAAALGTLSTLTDNVETVTGLPASAVDIPPLGAAARILAAREARRSSLDSQPESRQAQDVPPGAARGASGQLFALRDRRIKEEAAKLSARYPRYMRRVG